MFRWTAIAFDLFTNFLFSLLTTHIHINDKITNIHIYILLLTVKIRILLLSLLHTLKIITIIWRKNEMKWETFVGCCRWILNALHSLHVIRHISYFPAYAISHHFKPTTNTIHHARNEWKSSVGRLITRCHVIYFFLCNFCFGMNQALTRHIPETYVSLNLFVCV